MNITPEMRQAIERSGDEPLRLEDPLKRETYVLLKASAFERIERLLAPLIRKQDEWQLADAYAAADEAFHEGWEKHPAWRITTSTRSIGREPWRCCTGLPHPFASGSGRQEAPQSGRAKRCRQRANSGHDIGQDPERQPRTSGRAHAPADRDVQYRGPEAPVCCTIHSCRAITWSQSS